MTVHSKVLTEKFNKMKLKRKFVNLYKTVILFLFLQFTEILSLPNSTKNVTTPK